MGKPRTDYRCAVSGATSEIAAAMSSLAMDPEPIPNPEEVTGLDDPHFLCDVDHWARHAVDHLGCAIQLVGRARSALADLQKQVFQLYREHRITEPVFRELLDTVDRMMYEHH